MERQIYGECEKCNKWGYAPKEFNESIHFLRCLECNGPMFLMHGYPSEVGNNERNKMEAVGVMKQFG